MLTLTADDWPELATAWRRAWLAKGKASPRHAVTLKPGVFGPVAVIWRGQARTAVDKATGLPLDEPS